MGPKTRIEIAKMEGIPYQQAIGCLLFLAQGTKPDIAHAVNCANRFNNSYGRPHWVAVKRIMRYLKGTSGMKLIYENQNNHLIFGYTEADWAGDIDERKSTTGYVFFTFRWCYIVE